MAIFRILALDLIVVSILFGVEWWDRTNPNKDKSKD